VALSGFEPLTKVILVSSLLVQLLLLVNLFYKRLTVYILVKRQYSTQGYAVLKLEKTRKGLVDLER
jgi:hypothetical protein